MNIEKLKKAKDLVKVVEKMRSEACVNALGLTRIPPTKENIDALGTAYETTLGNFQKQFLFAVNEIFFEELINTHPKVLELGPDNCTLEDKNEIVRESFEVVFKILGELNKIICQDMEMFYELWKIDLTPEEMQHVNPLREAEELH